MDIKTPPALLKSIYKAQGKPSFPDASQSIVTNVSGSSDYKAPDDCSCIEYWEREAGFEIDGRKSYICPGCGRMVRGCQFEGAHVTVSGLPTSKWFFVPLCPDCNRPTNTDPMNVDTFLIPVPDECYEKIEQ